MTLYVGGLPPRTMAGDGAHRGYAFVTLRNARAAIAALDGRELLGRKVAVRIARAPRLRRRTN
jgi:hypothetical protein